MTPEEFAERMRAIPTGEREADHWAADELLCELLCLLGYDKGVEEFWDIDKLYGCACCEWPWWRLAWHDSASRRIFLNATRWLRPALKPPK